MENDLISRSALLKELEDDIVFYRQKAKFAEHAELWWARINELQEFRDTIKHARTVEQPQGKWIRVDKDKMKCSKCEVIHFIAQYPMSANINYCPNCGAKNDIIREKWNML